MSTKLIIRIYYYAKNINGITPDDLYIQIFNPLDCLSPDSTQEDIILKYKYPRMVQITSPLWIIISPFKAIYSISCCNVMLYNLTRV